MVIIYAVNYIFNWSLDFHLNYTTKLWSIHDITEIVFSVFLWLNGFCRNSLPWAESFYNDKSKDMYPKLDIAASQTKVFVT